MASLFTFLWPGNPSSGSDRCANEVILPFRSLNPFYPTKRIPDPTIRNCFAVVLQLPQSANQIIRNQHDINQITDSARGVLSDSDSDGILNDVMPHSRPWTWDLGAFLGKRLPLSTDGKFQVRTLTV